MCQHIDLWAWAFGVLAGLGLAGSPWWLADAAVTGAVWAWRGWRR